MDTKIIVDGVVNVVGTITAGCCWFRFMKYLDARYIVKGPVFQAGKDFLGK